MKSRGATIGLGKRLLFVLILAFIGLLLFEVVARYTFPEFNLSNNWKYHPVLGWSQVPGGNYDYEQEGRTVHVEFNSLGFRDVAHEIEKPPGVKRIVIIGDSYCESVQVNLEETFFKRLEKQLNERGGPKWEVINLGIGDHGNAQAWIALTEYGLRYSPDFVIHQIFPLNDICNNTVELAGLCKSRNDRYRPYFVERGGELVLTSAEPVRNFLRRHVVSYGVLERSYFRFVGDPVPIDNEGLDRLLSELGFPPLGPLLYTYVDDREQMEQTKRGWRVTERILQKIASTCKDHGVALLPVVVPFVAMVKPESRDSYMSGLPPPKIDPDYPDRRLAHLFARLGAPYVLLKPVFKAHPGNLYLADGHLNTEGHSVMAQALYDKMLEAGLMRKSSNRPRASSSETRDRKRGKRGTGNEG